jgi:hypothetical protein
MQAAQQNAAESVSRASVTPAKRSVQIRNDR